MIRLICEAERVKLRKDNCHTGYAAEGKVVWKFDGSDQSILFRSLGDGQSRFLFASHKSFLLYEL